MSPVPSTWKTGKRNLLASIVEYLQTQLPGENIVGSHYLQTETFPVVTIEDSGIFSLGDIAFDELVGFDSSGNPIRGKIEQTQLQIQILDRLSDSNRAPIRGIRKLRDRVKYALFYAGVPDGSGGFVLPPIKILDFENAKADTGFIAWVPRELDSAWVETFIQDDGTPPVWRYRIYCRVYWWEIRE